MTDPSKLDQKRTTMEPEQNRILTEPMEAACLFGGNTQEWFARFTWKCPVCGRRNQKLIKGTGVFEEQLPITVVCKFGHQTPVKPYRT